MAGEISWEDSGQNTPVEFRDTPGQWYTVNHRKRSALSQLDGEPTQRVSQMTQTATKRARPLGERTVPVLIATMPSQEETDDFVHEENDVDEEETQIRMTNSEEQEVPGAPRLERKIVEEIVPLSIPSAVSCASRSVGDAGMKNSDDESNMSEDMLEQDGSVVGLSEIAALCRHREEDQEVVQNRIYKHHTFVRASPALYTRNHFDSSGGETEIEGEPAEELPVKSKIDTSDSLVFQTRLPRLVKSASWLKMAVQEDTSDSKTKSIRRSLSTREKTPNSTLLSRTSKRDQVEAPDRSHVKTKRSRLDEDDTSLECSNPKNSLENEKAVENSNGDDQHKRSTPPQLADEIILDISEDNSSRSDEVQKALSRPASRVPRKLPTSRKCVSVNDSESTGSQSEGGSIRIILTGLEPTAAIRKRIKSITDAVYESNIEKATHLVAPQNQLKRTVKLLCGISCCTHILGERWLDQSARAGVAVDEQANCLHDEEAERKWQFDLRRTMYDVSSKQRQRLFAGYSVFITHHKSVLPPGKDLVKIVQCAGGKASSKGKPTPHDVVISSEVALTVASVRKQLLDVNPERIYSPELILSSVLQQRVELDKHRLKLPAIGKAWTTKR